MIDPELFIHPVTPHGAYRGQVSDFIQRAKKVIQRGGRVIATTLTKVMAEDLTNFLIKQGMKATYVHSDVKTIDRIILLTEFRKGVYDVLVGVNLLREGLDLPEVEFIGILDADKEGFLRSETSLIQTIGRASRNIYGRVVLYADVMTGSLQRACDETNRRRVLQIAYNKKHHITPKTIRKEIHDIAEALSSSHEKTVLHIIAIEQEQFAKAPRAFLKKKRAEMNKAVTELDFETAAIIRDEMRALERGDKS